MVYKEKMHLKTPQKPQDDKRAEEAAKAEAEANKSVASKAKPEAPKK